MINLENNNRKLRLTVLISNAYKYLKSEGQRTLVLEMIEVLGGVTTFEMRACGIPSPSSRISELKKQGYSISSNWVNQFDSASVMHRICYYTMGHKL